jgi:hypothetical protein
MSIRSTLLQSPVVLLLATGALAAEVPQSMFLERGESQASGKQVRTFGVPTTDALGVVSYWDITVDLSVSDTGKPQGNASVTAVKQPKVRTNRLIPGTYTDSSGGTCTVHATTLTDGRQEASGSCTSTIYTWNFTVDNGDIAGHPFELQLLSAQIDKIPGYRDYNWGVDGATSGNYGGCFYTNYIISARQVGPQIVITRYGYDNIGDCGATLTQSP